MVGVLCIRRVTEWKCRCKNNFVQNLVGTAIVNQAWKKALNLIKYGLKANIRGVPLKNGLI